MVLNWKREFWSDDPSCYSVRVKLVCKAYQTGAAYPVCWVQVIFEYSLHVGRLHYSTAHNHFIIVAPSLKVLYNSPHPEIQPHGATSVFQMLFYMLICYHETLSSS